MNQELAIPETQIVASQRGVQLTSFDELMRFAQMAVESRLCPKGLDTPAAALMAIQAGLEIGLSPFQALQSMAVINGRAVIYGDAALAVVKAHPQFVDIVETLDRGDTDETMMAVCVISRKGQSEVRRTFSVADAKKAKLWGKGGPWSDYAKRMLQFRARGFAMRDSFPDALKGIRIAEEVMDYHEKLANGKEVKKAEGLVLPGEEISEVTSTIVEETPNDLDLK